VPEGFTLAGGGQPAGQSWPGQTAPCRRSSQDRQHGAFCPGPLDVRAVRPGPGPSGQSV